MLLQSIFLQLYIISLIIWFVPLIASFFFYSRKGELQINYFLFKFIMIIISTATTIFTFKKIHNWSSNVEGLGWIYEVAFIILIQIINDLIVLVKLLKMPLKFFIKTILPVYLTIIPISCYFFLN